MIAFFIFILITVLLFFLFEILFMPSIYRSIKLNELKSNTEKMISLYGSDTFYSESQSTATKYNLCLLLIDPINQSKTKLSGTQYPGAVLYDLSYNDCLQLYTITKQNGGTSLLIIEKEESSGSSSSNGMKKPSEQYSVRNYSSSVAVDTGLNVLYGVIFTDDNGQELMLISNSFLSPITAEVRSMTLTLGTVSGISILLALFIAAYLSRKVASPIVKINKKAKALGEGNYKIHFDEQVGYLEANELSATLNQAATELAKVEDLRRELIANVSHDLRTPLTLISGYSEVMRDIPGEVTPENLQTIIDEVARLNSLVNDMLELSKIQSGNISLHPTDFDFTTELEKIMDTYRTLTERQGYHMKLLQDKQPILVHADVALITRAVMNLINNAMTYTGADKSVTVLKSYSDDNVRVEVTDTGNGISPDKLELIWDRYYKVDAEHKRAAQGTGLGLSIVKSIVTMHNGSYGVRSREGVGSTFWFEIPRKKDSPNR